MTQGNAFAKLQKNSCNTHIVWVFCEYCDGKFCLKRNLLSRLPKICWTITRVDYQNFQVSGASIYAKLFYESEKSPVGIWRNNYVQKNNKKNSKIADIQITAIW